MSVPTGLPVADLTTYLSARKGLIAARTGLFDAVRAYLRPEQRPDAVLFGDPLADSKTRVIDEASWVANPVRGYLVVLESEAAGRPFRLCVLQQGNELRVGVRYSPPARIGEVDQRLLFTFAQAALVSVRGTECMVDWHFDAQDLYQSAQAFEDAVYKVGAVFESALQALVPADKSL